jgi:uncharacterized protein GlcG (DUF336 family)
VNSEFDFHRTTPNVWRNEFVNRSAMISPNERMRWRTRYAAPDHRSSNTSTLHNLSIEGKRRSLFLAITSHQAQTAIAAGEAHAAEIGVPVNIAVLDAGAHLKAFSRMDGTLIGSIDIAIGKARTAALFGMRTEAIGEFCKPGGTSPGLEQTNGGLVVFAGGIPLTGPDGAVIGAVGVSGGSVAQDREIA